MQSSNRIKIYLNFMIHWEYLPVHHLTPINLPKNTRLLHNFFRSNYRQPIPLSTNNPQTFWPLNPLLVQRRNLSTSQLGNSSCNPPMPDLWMSFTMLTEKSSLTMDPYHRALLKRCRINVYHWLPKNSWAIFIHKKSRIFPDWVGSSRLMRNPKVFL